MFRKVLECKDTREGDDGTGKLRSRQISAVQLGLVAPKFHDAYSVLI